MQSEETQPKTSPANSKVTLCVSVLLAVGFATFIALWARARGDLRTLKSQLESAQLEAQLQSRDLTAAREALSLPAKERAALTGSWRCQITVPGQQEQGLFSPSSRSAIQLVIDLSLPYTGNGHFTEWHDNKEVDNFEGAWSITGKYLIVERPNGGYGSFKVAAKSESKLTLISRMGQILEFTRIK